MLTTIFFCTVSVDSSKKGTKKGLPPFVNANQKSKIYVSVLSLKTINLVETVEKILTTSGMKNVPRIFLTDSLNVNIINHKSK